QRFLDECFGWLAAGTLTPLQHRTIDAQLTIVASNSTHGCLYVRGALRSTIARRTCSRSWMLIHFAASHGLQAAAKECLLRAYFTDGLVVGAPATNKGCKL